MTSVFISWSGEKSKEIAEELRNWIPSVLQFARPYFTPNDIEKGAKWSAEISKKLSESNVGIICLTKDNLNKPWILFEAGALSKDLDHSRVCSVLFGMDNSDLSGPLTVFQTTSFEKGDFRKLMLTINDSGGPSTLARETFDRVFDMWWPQLEEKIGAILSKEISAKDANLRSDREILEEVLLMTRSFSRLVHRDRDIRDAPLALVRDFIETLEKIMNENRKLLSLEINVAVGSLLKILTFVSRSGGRPDPEMASRIESLRQAQDDFIPF